MKKILLTGVVIGGLATALALKSPSVSTVSPSESVDITQEINAPLEHSGEERMYSAAELEEMAGAVANGVRELPTTLKPYAQEITLHTLRSPNGLEVFGELSSEDQLVYARQCFINALNEYRHARNGFVNRLGDRIERASGQLYDNIQRRVFGNGI